MSKKHKKRGRNLNYIDHSLIVVSRITGCVSISVSSAIGLKICAIIAGIKKYKSIIKKKKKKHA